MAEPADRSEDEAFRSLMKILSKAQSNGCVQCALNQTLMRSLAAVDLSIRILDMLQKLKSENTDYLIGNLAVDNQFCKEDIWLDFYVDCFAGHFCVWTMKWAVAYSFMVLHTCLDEHKVEQLAQPGNTHLALKVMELCRTVRTELDVVLIAIQHFLKSSMLVKNMYAGMSHQRYIHLVNSRIYLLIQILETSTSTPEISNSWSQMCDG
uniref:Uncharacterized protein n=1 Tax=Oncorhynchus kisutch TaxID=8019 RepID=A0A8C7K770_ONCKI